MSQLLALSGKLAGHLQMEHGSSTLNRGLRHSSLLNNVLHQNLCRMILHLLSCLSAHISVKNRKLRTWFSLTSYLRLTVTVNSSRDEFTV